MALNHELISQFAKLVNNDTKQSSESTVYGTVKVDANGNKYVQLDGSDQLTPLTEENQPSVDTALAKTHEEDRVSVLIKDHTATVTGNISSPAVGDDDVETAITKFDIAVGDQIQANKAYFKDLVADKANLGNLTAAIISVAELIAKDAEIENLVAEKATMTDIIAKKIDADVVIADSAIVEHLKAGTIDVLSLIADKAVIEDLVANNVDLNSVEAKNAYLKYATIDFSNIGEAAISKVFADSGIIKDLIVSEGKITGELVGVTIKGDLIEGNTIVADKLVVKGEDGLYYKLNAGIDGITEEQLSDEKYQNGLHGSAIIAETITADKIRVTDLIAFGATIGRFHIDDDEETEVGAIYSGVKNSVDNNTRGIYMDTEGQFAVGDESNFIKFAKNSNGEVRLDIAISGAGVKLNENGINVTKTDNAGNQIGDTNTQITENGVIVNDNNDENKPVLVANKNGVDAKNLRATTYITLANHCRFEHYESNGISRVGCFWIGE